MYHKKFTLQVWLLIFVVHCSVHFSTAQNGPGYTANNQVTPNSGNFEYGTNLGYYFGWADYQLGDLAKGNVFTNMEGIGATALRPGLFEHYLEEYGYSVNIPAYVHYDNLGLKNHTLFIGYASDEHRDTAFNCPTHFDKTRVFKNLYTPIWDDGTDGTPINDTNYYALFLYKMVQLYGPYIQYWEIWNEPDLDFKPGGIGWRGPGDPNGSWWDADPEVCDMQWGAPIEHYNRLMRISWEVIKTYDPDSYVCVGGLGFPSFLDAMMRNTDNPVDGSVTPEYPLKGGAYFDVLSFHSYPHINGSLQEYDPVANQVILKRNTDQAVRGIVEDLNDFKTVMVNYGYDGLTYPEKETIMTESSIPRIKFGNYIGSEEAASNYLIKLPIYLQKEKVRQFHVYDLGEKKDAADAMYPFDATGLYENPVGQDFSTIKRTNQGIAYKTVSDLLYEKTYDEAQTNALALPPTIDGAAFKDANGEFMYVLWAITQLDDSEDANANYSFPSSFNLGTLEKMTWDFALTEQKTFSNSSNIALTGAPLFLQASMIELAITCPLDINVELDTTTNDVQVTWLEPTISSLCDSASVLITQTSGLANGSLFTEGTHTITYEATDTCGNTVTCNFDVIVSAPAPPPPLSCPNDEHKFTLNVVGNGSVDVEYRDPLDVTINYPTGTHITCMVDNQLLRLIPVPGQGETFDGWSMGGCSGTGVCWKGITWETEITAVFTSINASTAPTISATTTDVSCFSGDDGSITTTAQNGTPAYTYLWSTGETTSDLNNLIAGAYTVTVTDSEGETASISKTITQPSNLIGLLASKSDLDCASVEDGFVSATAVGGTPPYTFSWSNGETTITIDDLPAGTYTVTISDTNNCQTTVEETLIATTLASPMADFSKISNGLVVDFTDISTGVPTSWNWDFGDGNISNIAAPSHTYATSGTFTVCLIVENDCGLNAFCQDVTTLSISTTTTDILCFGDSTGSIVTNTLAGTTYAYIWNTGDTTANLNNIIAGTYTVTITNASGESATISATINEPTLLAGSISSQTDVGCIGGADGTATATGSGGTTPYSYEWSNGETTAAIVNLVADTYTVTITDSNGCTSTTEAVIADGNVSGPVADFETSTNGLTVNFTDVSSSYIINYIWDFGDGTTSNATGATHTYATDSTYNVCMIAISPCGQDTLCKMISTLSVSAQTTDVLCYGDNTGSIITVAGGANQVYTYLWNTGGTTAMLNNLTAGTYTVTVTNIQGDSTTLTETITEPTELDITIVSQNDATCFQGEDGDITVAGTGGLAPYTYNWTGGRSGATITDLTQGIYTVTVIDANTCATTLSIFVDMGTTASPSAFFSYSAVGLTLDFIDLSTDVPTNWDWDFGDGNIANTATPIHTYDTIGMYNVCLMVDNACGQDTFCQNISVGLDNNVSMSIGTASGNSGDTVQIPFMVVGFENVITFQHSVSISDSSKATFVGISWDTTLTNNNPAVTNVLLDAVSVSWINNSAPLTVPDSSILYYLDLIIKGQPNECVDIVIDGVLTPIEFVMADSTGAFIGTYNTTSGEVCANPGVIIDGLIAREDGMEIEDVDIFVNGNTVTTTSTSGTYTLPPYSSNDLIVIEPHKDINHVNGVTSFDLALIQQHIVGTFPLDSPYKIIAADVNRSGNVSSFDLFLTQQVIVGNADTFPNNESWRFVPTAHLFTDVTDPWAGVGFPESISISGMTGNVSDQDFVAIKVADVTNSAAPNIIPGSNQTEARASNSTFEFFIDKKINTQTKEGYFEFTANDFNQLSAFELDILFDKNKIKLERIESDQLNLIHGTKLLEEGILSLIWFDKTGNIEGQSFDDQTVLFKMYFTDLANTTESPTELLRIDNSVRHSNAYSYDGSPREIQLTSFLTENSVNHVTPEFFISPNQPNPFNEKTEITFQIPMEKNVIFDVFDTNGKVVYHLEQFFPKGKNRIQVYSKNLPHEGVYYFRIKTNHQEGISKMVLVK